MYLVSIYSDGGKNKKKGPYGSYQVIYKGEVKKEEWFEYDASYTAPDTEAVTLANAMLYAKELAERSPVKLSFSFYTDTDWLYGHITKHGREIAKKHQSIVEKLRSLHNELGSTLILIDGDEMKSVLGH